MNTSSLWNNIIPKRRIVIAIAAAAILIYPIITRRGEERIRQSKNRLSPYASLVTLWIDDIQIPTTHTAADVTGGLKQTNLKPEN